MDIERVKKFYSKGSGAHQQGPEGRPGKRVKKRWHTIPFESEACPDHARAWPAWVCDSTTYVLYCFEHQASYDALTDLFLSGLEKWAQAFRTSSVGIVETSVHIMQPKHGQTWPFSSLGYTKPPIAKVCPSMPRHFIRWPTNTGISNARGPLHMAQQIGEA